MNTYVLYFLKLVTFLLYSQGLPHKMWATSIGKALHQIFLEYALIGEGLHTSQKLSKMSYQPNQP